MEQLIVKHTQTFDGKPLAIVRNFPGLDADMTPEQMRGLACALLAAAGECEECSKDKSGSSRIERHYPALHRPSYPPGVMSANAAAALIEQEIARLATACSCRVDGYPCGACAQAEILDHLGRETAGRERS